MKTIPTKAFISGYSGVIPFAATAALMTMVRVDKEKVRAQPGGFYGGWITDEIVRPFKGQPGTSHW